MAIQKDIEGFLFVSSGAVYRVQPPDLERIPEDYLGALDVTNIRSAYGEAKRYAEMLCTLYHQRHGLPMHIARPFTFVGPYQDLNSGFAITDFIRDGLQGGPLTIQGDGTTVRSYCYAADLTAMLWKILLQSSVGRVYNVGSDESISILELANKVISSGYFSGSDSCVETKYEIQASAVRARYHAWTIGIRYKYLYGY
ncbi:MAG: NAD-dependent epimerase/dehydratase family protein [Acetobacterium woodii]|nr:NAD-dependent epimerase/dehydratase family protein [Acetobacterium woodii]MBI5677807.1 NAD-dependent epimerase/dehydratase family protein [Planctomycetota bacterium]